MTSELVQLVKGVPVTYQDMGLVAGNLAVMLDTLQEPVFEWKGERIPSYLWKQIVSFMCYTDKKYYSEAQLRLVYQPEHDWWDVVVLPQYVGTGMSSKEIADHKNREAILAQYEGWKEWGTVHHHCAGVAFQSGTDLNDEKEKNGVHITLGHIGSEVMSAHCRVSFRTLFYGTVLEDWVEGDEPLVATTAVFPEAWKDQLFLKPKPVAVQTVWAGWMGAKPGRRFHVPLSSCKDPHDWTTPSWKEDEDLGPDDDTVEEGEDTVAIDEELEAHLESLRTLGILFEGLDGVTASNFGDLLVMLGEVVPSLRVLVGGKGGLPLASALSAITRMVTFDPDFDEYRASELEEALVVGQELGAFDDPEEEEEVEGEPNDGKDSAVSVPAGCGTDVDESYTPVPIGFGRE